MGDADSAQSDVDIVHDDSMSGLLEPEPEEAAESSGQDKKRPWSWFDSAIHQLTQVLSNDDVGLMERSGAMPQHDQFHDNMVTLCQRFFAVGMSLCLTFCWTKAVEVDGKMHKGSWSAAIAAIGAAFKEMAKTSKNSIMDKKEEETGESS